MTLRFTDSFDYYGTAQLPLFYDFMQGAGYQASAIAGGRFASGLQLAGYVGKTLDYQTTWIVGAAFNNRAGRLLTLGDDYAVQCGVAVDGLGRLYVFRGWSVDITNADGTAFPIAILATGSTLIGTGWHYIEFKATIGATGSYEVRVDGLTYLSGSGVNTQQSANARANRVQIGLNSLGISVDDVYICDGTGTANNNFLGDVRVQALMPSADGDLSQLTPSTGTTHYNLVDEVPPDGDTSYVSGATAGNVDLYQLGDVAAVSGSILGVAVYSFARKDDAGTRTIANVIKTGGVEYDGPAQALSMSYTYFTEHWETNPATGLPWTIADVNALQAGVKVVA